MSGRWKIGLAILLGAAIAVPATVIARGNTTSSGPADSFASASVESVSTNSTSYVPLDLQLPETASDMAITLSAQMTKGRAKFRVVSGANEAVPSPVQFDAKAANSFVFGAETSCPHLHVEWKRTGDAPAKAALVSYLAVYDVTACT